MSWLDRIRSLWRSPVKLGGAAANPSLPGPGTGRRTSRNEARSRGSQPAPLSGYGANPYDTYTWELHTDDGERRLKRTADVSRRDDPGGDPSNPYDTGTFRGGW